MAKQISWRKLPYYWPLYLFVLPSAALVAIFRYYVAGSAFYHAFFRWDGDTIKRFIGLQHFDRALGIPWLWVSATAWTFALLYSARKSGRIPGMLQRMAGISALVVNLWLIRNHLSFPADVQPGCLIPLLIWGVPLLALIVCGDRLDPGRPVRQTVLGVLLTGHLLAAAGLYANAAWSMALLAAGILLWSRPAADARFIAPLRAAQALTSMGVILWSLALHSGGDAVLWRGFGVVSILVAFNIVKMLPSILTAVVIHRLKSDRANYWYRVLFVIPMIIPGMVYLLIWKFFFQPDGVLNLVLQHSGILRILIYLDRAMGLGGIFTEGAAPAWLGHPDLVLPAMILWGFPWVGIVGVLIYLAGLQSIPDSVYEAADVDGIGPIGKLRHIEFPLILTQVRINLVLLIIGTLQSYANILILFSDTGGPNGRLMIPGLWMFRHAFSLGEAGYACAVGLILFVFILLLTEINNRFVRVEK